MFDLTVENPYFRDAAFVVAVLALLFAWKFMLEGLLE